jgi:hypothetical protein
MAETTDLNEQELESLRKGVVGAGLLVSVSDRGFIDTFKEAGTLAKHVANARESNSSELVRQVAEVRGAGFGLTSSPQEVEGETLEALRSAVATLEVKAPSEVDAYRDFVIDVAESVAGAGEGGATGESAALEKIRSALREPSTT